MSNTALMQKLFARDLWGFCRAMASGFDETLLRKTMQVSFLRLRSSRYYALTGRRSWLKLKTLTLRVSVYVVDPLLANASLVHCVDGFRRETGDGTECLRPVNKVAPFVYLASAR